MAPDASNGRGSHLLVRKTRTQRHHLSRPRSLNGRTSLRKAELRLISESTKGTPVLRQITARPTNIPVSATPNTEPLERRTNTS